MLQGNSRGVTLIKDWAEFSKAGLDAYASGRAAQVVRAMSLVPGRPAGPVTWPVTARKDDTFPDGTMQVATALVAARQLAYAEAMLASADEEDAAEARGAASVGNNAFVQRSNFTERAEAVGDIQGWQRAVAMYACGGVPRAPDPLTGPPHTMHMMNLGMHAADAVRLRRILEQHVQTMR